MSEKVLKIAGQRRTLLVLIVMAMLTFGLLFSGWLTPTPMHAQQGDGGVGHGNGGGGGGGGTNSGGGGSSTNTESPDCVVSSVSTTCYEGSVFLTNASVSPGVGCIGSGFSASVTQVILAGLIVTNTSYTNANANSTNTCDPSVTSNSVPPTIVSNWWSASVGSFSTNGTGLSASFTPTDCGSGSVTFNTAYQDVCDTNINTTSASGSFTVLSLKIVDGGGKTISSANSNNAAIVGQGIGLTAQTCGGTFSNYQWTVPGYAISNYDISNGKLYTSFPTTNSRVSFYWVDGGSKQVSCSAVCGGVSCSTNVSFTVVRPTAQITPWTTSVNVVGNAALVFGNFVNGVTTQGITFSNAITIPANFTGSTVWAQVVTSTARSEIDANGTNHVYTPSCQSPYADLPTPYEAHVGTNYVDSPSIALYANYTSASAKDEFEMWMMFQPSGGIPVPLRAVNWYWSGTAENISGTWTLQAGTTNSVGPSDFDTTTFPLWNCAIGSGNWVPSL